MTPNWKVLEKQETSKVHEGTQMQGSGLFLSILIPSYMTNDLRQPYSCFSGGFSTANTLPKNKTYRLLLPSAVLDIVIMKERSHIESIIIRFVYFSCIQPLNSHIMLYFLLRENIRIIYIFLYLW